MGSVYEVEDATSGARVALKVMDDAGGRQVLRFKNEFRLASELRHPNLVRLHELFFEDGFWFFTMDCIDGQSLVDALHESPGPSEGTTRTLAQPVSSIVPEWGGDPDKTAVTPTATRRMACDFGRLSGLVVQLVGGLEHLHGHGIVHRDLKPTNVLVEADGGLRILDFGLATPTDRTQAISRTGTVVGTLAYMAPEQCRGGRATPESDLYALGVLLFELMAGERPFGGNAAQVLHAKLNARAPSLDAIVSGVPPRVSTLVGRLLDDQPILRPSLDEVLDAFASGPASGSARAPTASTPVADRFVGRDAEMLTLTRALEQARDGRPQLVQVWGRPGVGKSAVSARVCRAAKDLDFLVFRSVTSEREVLPYAGIDRAVDRIVETLSRWSPSQLAPVRSALHRLAAIFPAISAVLGDEEPSAESAGSDVHPLQRRQQAFDAFRRLVAYLADFAPVALVIDDADRMDVETRELLESIAGDPPDRLLLATFSRQDDDGAPPAPPASGCRLVRLRLDPLADADVASLIGEVAPGADRSATDAIIRAAAGAPSVAMRLARRAGVSSERERPTGVGEQMLSALTVLGPAPAALVAAAIGCTEDQVRHTAEDLAGAGYLQPQDDGATIDLATLDSWDSQTTSGISTAERRRMLRSAAEHVEREGTPTVADAELAARLWAEAGEPERRRPHLRRIAAHAESVFAFGRAAELYRELAETAGDRAADGASLFDEWQRAGELFDCAARYGEAADAYQRAVAAFGRLGSADPNAIAERVRCEGRLLESLVGAGRMDEAEALLGPLCQSVGIGWGGSRIGRFLRVVRLAASVRLLNWLPPRWRERQPDALARAHADVLDCLVRIAPPLWSHVAVEAALLSEVLGLRIDDKSVIQRSLAMRGMVPVVLRPNSSWLRRRAARYLDQAEELAEVHDLWEGRALVWMNRGMLAMQTSPARARESLDAALREFDRRGLRASPSGAAAWGMRLGMIVVSGDHRSAVRTIEEYFARGELHALNTAVANLSRVVVLGVSGNVEALPEAVDEMTRAMEHGVRLPIVDLALAWAELARGNAEGAYQLAHGLDRRSGSSGDQPSVMVRRHARELVVEAASQGLIDGSLTEQRRREAIRIARKLSRSLVPDACGCGFAGRAMLAVHASRDRRMRWARRALEVTNDAASPPRRFRVLAVARHVGVRSTQVDQEFDRLVLEHDCAPLGLAACAPGLLEAPSDR